MPFVIKSDERRLKVRVNRLTDDMKKGIKVKWQEIGRDLKAQLRRDMLTAKSGRIYRFRGTEYQASAPGETVASRSGETYRGIGYRAYGWYKMEFGYRSPYSRYFEAGTRYMAKRPGLQNAVDKRQMDIHVKLRNIGIR